MATAKVRTGSAKRPVGSDSAAATDVIPLMKKVADRLGKSKSVRKGLIVLRLRGTSTGDFCFDCALGKVKLLDRAPVETDPPLIEVIGQDGAIQEILESRADPVSLFYRGRFCVRGDLQYLSSLALEFGLIKQPL
jgi:hypothetical protein